MKRFMLPVLAILFCLLGCSDDSGTKPDNPKPSPYSGMYTIFAPVVSNDCAHSPDIPLSGQVTIMGDEIDFLGFDGAWDDAAKRGSGVADERTLVIDPIAGCIGYYVVTFDVTFASLDSFAGTMSFDYHYSPQCSASVCRTDLEIIGKRQ